MSPNGSCSIALRHKLYAESNQPEGMFMKVTKGIIATVAIVFSALLLGGVSSAHASTNTHYQCHHGTFVGVVNCSAIVINAPVTITIKNTGRSLSDNELNLLEVNLDNLGNDINILDIKNVTINTLAGFSPKIIISDNDIVVCVASVCG